MVAVERLVRFYVDESAMGLGQALAAARKDTIHCAHPLIPECPSARVEPTTSRGFPPWPPAALS